MTDMHEINTAIATCTDDIKTISGGDRISLDAQVRAYDLLSSLLEAKDYGLSGISPDAAQNFCAAYVSVSDSLAAAFAADELKKEAEARLQVLKAAEKEVRFEAAAAASLHEFAKETFETWQTAGIFARRRALRDLRERAGFRLESHRIGNYVAKTFDLMNEAHTRFARAQQAVFAADVSYKCRTCAYQAIYDFLKTCPERAQN